MALSNQEVIHGNSPVARIIELTDTDNVLSSAMGTVYDIGTAVKVTPTPGKPQDISYADLKIANGVTMRAEQNNEVVSAKDGTSIAGADLDNMKFNFAPSFKQRNALTKRAKTQDPVILTIPGGYSADDGVLVSWYYILGKITDISLGDINDDNIQTIDITITGSLAFSYDDAAAFLAAFNVVNSGASGTPVPLYGFGEDTSGTGNIPLELDAADMTLLINGTIIEKEIT